MRSAREEQLPLELKSKLSSPVEYKVPDGDGLRIAVMIQPVGTFASQSGLPDGARTISVFLINRRTPKELDEVKDEAFAFQAGLELQADRPFLSAKRV